VGNLKTEIRRLYKTVEEKHENFLSVVNEEQLELQVREKEATTSEDGFWDDARKAQDVMMQLDQVKASWNQAVGLRERRENVDVIVQMMEEGEEDRDLLSEAQESLSDPPPCEPCLHATPSALRCPCTFPLHP